MVEFRYPTAASPTTSWTPSSEPVFPLEERVEYPHQLSEETAGGTVYVQDKGVQREVFDLQFNRVSKTDRDNAKTFFTAVKGRFNTFEYIDPDGVNRGPVRWMNEFNFRHVVQGKWSGTITLRKE